MLRKLIAPFLFSFCFIAQAQYTETINSNRPGNSQGAFSVGNQVFQLETGLLYGKDDHDLRQYKTNLFGIDYELRYGVLQEQFEINIRGTYLFSNQKYMIGSNEQEYKFSNFQRNTIGAKYLIYDPYKDDYLEKPNVRSWRENHRFKWKYLIPAVSIYAGANLLFGDNPYKYETESSISPQIVLATQNNWRTFVFVMNFVVDKISEEYPTYAGIFTMTHAVSRKTSIFGEYQVIKSDIYSDNIFRGGAAYLFNKDFQVDASGLVNFKNTPFKWQVAVGVSYRLDMHSQDEILDDGKNKKDKKAKKKKEEKGAEDENIRQDGFNLPSGGK